MAARSVALHELIFTGAKRRMSVYRLFTLAFLCLTYLMRHPQHWGYFDIFAHY